MDITPPCIGYNWRAVLLLEDIWYRGHPCQWLLWPLSLLFGALSAIRRFLYRHGWLRSVALPVPVIVVGNISVGGTGKTPFTIWLVDYLQKQGMRPGIISRGYGGSSTAYPLTVAADADPAVVGDEPLLLARRCACPVMIDPDRVRAGQALIARFDVDVIISDDGLQHYALRRSIEFVIVDARRRQGNGLLLPAGPLREPLSRLDDVDLVLVNGAEEGEAGFDLQHGNLCHLSDERRKPLSAFAGQQVHAVAGIGNPERFFRYLESHAIQLYRHPYPDHHQFAAEDIKFNDDLPVFMTEKDAVKCRSIATDRHWFLPVDAVPNAAGSASIIKSLAQLVRPTPG